ncbi:unnamed protein product [Phyllotreta striolata]|uniref:Yellow-e n=1 Tax=Phyllotreta striolata TaxID=444603 RepID=A0A9N9TS89_PHYSR|nr:unnamed protein product [Phyllotreta striolata]
MKRLLFMVALIACVIDAHSLELVNQWGFLNFDFPPNFDLKFFRPENSVLTGMEITDDRIFLAMPRLRSGVPAVLSTIPRNTPGGSSPILQAYPDWSMHGAATGNYNCSGLISVYRIRTDSCNRLWVLDSGTVNTLEDFTVVCPPKLLIFDIKTDQIVRTVVFPKEVVRPVSVFTNLIIDESLQGKCDSAFVYISDTVAGGIVVYDGATDRTWRFSDPSMFPNPDHATISIVGERFTLMDGVIGLAHSPQLATLFYQPVASDRIFSVPTSALTKGPPAEFEEFPVRVAGRKSSQGLPLAMNERENVLYFSPFSETSLASWNVLTNEQEILASDPSVLQFVAEIRWKSEDGSVYLLVTRFHKFFRRTVSQNEVNLRILRLPAKRELPKNFDHYTSVTSSPVFPRLNHNFYFK